MTVVGGRWDAEAARRITSSYESKRSEEMISGWLAFSPSVAVSLTVRAVQEARLDHVEAVRVLVQASPDTTVGMCKDILLEQQLLGGSAAPAQQQPQPQPPPSDCFSSSTINALHTTDRLLHVTRSSSDPPISAFSTDGPKQQQVATAWGEEPPGQQQQQDPFSFTSRPFAPPLPPKRSERGGQETWVSPSLLFAQVALQLGMTGYWKERVRKAACCCCKAISRQAGLARWLAGGLTTGVWLARLVLLLPRSWCALAWRCWGRRCRP